MSVVSAIQAARFAARRERALAEFVTFETELYCVDLAHVLDCSFSTAKHVLVSLESAGVLQSRWVPARCGPGRRYYQLRREAARKAVSTTSCPAEGSPASSALGNSGAGRPASEPAFDFFQEAVMSIVQVTKLFEGKWVQAQQQEDGKPLSAPIRLNMIKGHYLTVAQAREYAAELEMAISAATWVPPTKEGSF